MGRLLDAWAVPDWASAGPDGTFGNRFDDPDATYRVLYASSQKLGCFLETLARFRLDPKLMAELGEIDGDDDHFPLGEVPVEWVQRRILGVATAAGEYADICSSEWISRLRRALAEHLERFGLDDIDALPCRKRCLEYSRNLFRALSSTPALLAFTTFQNTVMTSKTGLC